MEYYTVYMYSSHSFHHWKLSYGHFPGSVQVLTVADLN